jgi:hypothetical protein
LNKRTFDLMIGVFAGGVGALAGIRLWAHRYLMEGKPDGPLAWVASVAKVVTG